MANSAHTGTWQFIFLGWVERLFFLRRKVPVIVVNPIRSLSLLRQQCTQQVRYRLR